MIDLKPPKIISVSFGSAGGMSDFCSFGAGLALLLLLPDGLDFGFDLDSDFDLDSLIN